MTPEEIIARLNLQPHPAEGGFFAETYRSAEETPTAALPQRYGGPRRHATAIYYLLTATTFSAMHRLRSDEIFHFYLGDPVEILHLYPDGRGAVHLLGCAVENRIRPQLAVPRGVWQGARLVRGGKLALLGTTVAPGFEFADFEIANREQLLATHSQFGELIAVLTR